MNRFICLLLVVLLLGCANIRGMERLAYLDDTSLTYEQALLSGNYRGAARFVRPEDGDAKAPDFSRLNNIKVTAYELMDKTSSPDNLSATRTVEIRYFHEHFLVEKTLVDLQRWEYDTEEGQWYLRSGLPDFR